MKYDNVNDDVKDMLFNQCCFDRPSSDHNVHHHHYIIIMI